MATDSTAAPAVTAAVADFIANVDMAALPEAAIEHARRAVADTLACMLAGSASELAPPLRAWLAAAPDGPARIVGLDRGAPPAVAALVNGSFAAALDYDDLMSPMHPSAVVVATLIGAPGPVSGRRLLEAYIVGIEVGAKLSAALGRSHPQRGFHATSTLSGFSAFAALARLQSLPAAQIETGLSLVASQSGGVLCQLGTMAKPLHSGLAARNAVEALALAGHGVTASRSVLEARRGYFEAYGGESSDPNLFAPSLGQPWAVLEPGSTLKRFPSSVAGHRGMLAVLELKRQGLTPANLVSLDCTVAPGALRPMGYPIPANGIESKFSMPYALAVALLDEPIGIASFETPATQRPEIAALLARITAREDPQQAIEDPVSAALSWGYRGYARVTAELADGRRLSARVDVPPGTPADPLSWTALHDKFQDCAASAGLAAQASSAVFEQLRALGRCPDIDPLLAALQVRQPTPTGHP